MQKTFLCVAFLFYSLCTYSQAIEWHGQDDSISIGRYSYILKEGNSALPFDQLVQKIESEQFVESDQAILNFGLTDADYWIRFTVENTTDTPILLEVAQAKLPFLKLLYKDSTGRWISQQAGYSIPLGSKIIKHHFQIFSLPAGKNDYYIWLKNTGAPVPITLWNQNVYEEKILHQLVTYGIYIGIMAFVILNNLFLFFSLRKPIYLHYAFLVVLYALFSAINDGYILYLFPNLDLMAGFVINPILNQPNGLLYCLFFLEVRKYAPQLYRISLGVTAYFISYIVWYRFLPLMTVLPLSQLHALIGISLMTFLGVKVGLRGNKLGYYFAFAYSLFFVIAAVEIMYINTGEPPYVADISHVSLGILIEVFILSYALSKRFEWEKKDIEKAKLEVQYQLLAKTRENEQLLKTQNENLEQEVNERTKAIAQKTEELQHSLDNLKSTQAQLIQKEKLASLGELTAGIAHEIQNPLNFVNNYSEVNVELIEELEEELEKGNQAEVQALLTDLEENERKINHHGRRADSIVRGMLEHARATPGEKALTDLNTLTDEYLRMAYQSIRVKHAAFQCELNKKFDHDLDKIDVAAADIGRVLFNLFNNAFYAVQQRQRQNGTAYAPLVSVSTKKLNGNVEIRIRDNGTGMPPEVMAKIFQPFFTTKPTGEGTGLGLSLSYDIVTKGHGGELRVESYTGEGTEFVMELPIAPASADIT